MKERKSLGTNGIDSSKQSVSIYYVAVPKDQPREQYIQNCFRTNTVMIRDEFGSTIRNVFVTNEVLPNLEFPENSKQIGTCVVCSRVNKHSMPLIIGSLNLKNQYSKVASPGDFSLFKRKGSNSAGIFGSSERSELNLHITSADDVKAHLNVNIVAKDHNASFTTYCKGIIQTLSTKLFNIVSNTKISLELNKENQENVRRIELQQGKTSVIDEENEYSLEISGGKFEFGKMGQAMERTTLGEKNKQRLEELIDLITQIQVSTPLGPSSIPINAPQLLQLKAQLSTILSENTKNN